MARSRGRDRDEERSSEETKERHDRELIELLNELRVALPGVQVLFAFLLTVPFSQGYSSITSAQKAAYFTAFLCAAASTAFLIAPSAYHRIQFRMGDKERMLRISNWLALVGTGFLAAAMVAVVFVITDIVIGGAWPPVLVGAGAGLFGGLWYGLPLYNRTRHD
jgi:Family of unknown function (DUF6328)